MFRIKGQWQILKDAVSGFRGHKSIKLSASLSFYTILTLGPMMIVIFFISNLFWGRQAIQGEIHHKIGGIIGDAAALKIQDIIKNSSLNSNNLMAFIGVAALIFAATTVFTEMQDSMNTIWNIKLKKGKVWKQKIKNRFISFLIVAGVSLLLLISLLINGVLEGFLSTIKQMFPQIGIPIVYIVNLLFTILVVALFFAFMFKILPDAHIRWRDVIAGALFTTVLFMAGKFAITFFLNITKMSSTYSSAGSLVILLLWIFYSSIVLYFGAECTKAYILKYGEEVRPKDYAVTVKVVTSESNKRSIQQNEQ